MTRSLLLAALAAAAAPAATPQDAPREKADDAKRERRVEQLQRMVDLEMRLREQEIRDAAALAVLERELRLPRLRAAADPPVAPPPREKRLPPAVVEEAIRLWAEKRVLLVADLRRAEAEAERAAGEQKRTDELFARALATAAQRDAARAGAEAARLRVEGIHRDMSDDARRYRETLTRHGIDPDRTTAEVTGTLAVDVVFPDAARARVAAAARALVEAATDALYDDPAAWDATLRLPNVRVRFAVPRPVVPVEGVGAVGLADVLVPLPLTRAPGGFVLVRDGERVVRFSKYPHDACVRFQEALAAAVPAAR